MLGLRCRRWLPVVALTLIGLSPPACRGDSLLVCRNLRLDESRLSIDSQSPGIVMYSIGDDGSETATNSGDPDVTALLDPTDTTRLSTGAHFRMEVAGGVQVTAVSYLQDDAGISILEPEVSQVGDSNFPSSTPFTEISVAIDKDVDYVNPGSAPWTDMRSITISYTTPDSSPGDDTRIRLVRLCLPLAEPNFCSITTADTFSVSCHDCGCSTCYSCGCSATTPWGSCGYGSCHDSSCWCSPACKCCNDCQGYVCDCSNCCDATSIEGCSLGATFGFTLLSPHNGIAGVETSVMVSGSGFFRNAPAITCKFADVESPGTFVSSTQISCTSPALSIPPGSGDSFSVPVSISLDGLTFTNPLLHEFTYVDCGGACSDSCIADACRCPANMFGSMCQHECNCEYGTCGSLTGICSCNSGWTGEACNVACPDHSGNICSNHGSCFFDEDESEAKCLCYDGYWGDLCQKDCPENDGKICNGRGSCIQESGECSCFSGYYGDACTSSCPGLEETGKSCSSNGVCCTGQGSSLEYTPCHDRTIGSSACDAGFSAADCSQHYCYNDCYDHGQCINGVCQCFEGYAGQFCSVSVNQDPTLSYFSFESEEYFSSEDIGTVSVNVTRYGSLSSDVSVYYETKDLTANAGEDYTPASNRLIWPAMNSDTKTIDILITSNPDVSEGQESFEIFLSSPLPSDRCQLGKKSKATVYIEAKTEEAGKDGRLARITIQVLRSIADVDGADGEVMKRDFVQGVVDSIDISHNQVFFDKSGGILAVAGADKISLTFDLIPNKGQTAGELGRAFIEAVADTSSALYSDTMRLSCPINTAYQPVVKVVLLEKEDLAKGKVNAAAIILPILLVLAILSAVGYWKRREGREWLLRKLAMWKFNEIDEEERGVRTNSLHERGMGSGMKSMMAGVFGGNNPSPRGWGAVVSSSDDNFSVGDVDDEFDGGGFAMSSNAGAVDGMMEMKTVAKAVADPADGTLLGKKKVLKIEL